MQKLIFTNSRGQSITITNSLPFVLSKFEGTGGTDTTILATKAPMQDGKTCQGVLLEERSLSIEGTIVGENSQDLYLKRSVLCSTFNSKINGTLIYENDSKQYKIPYIVKDITFKDKFEPAQEFLIQLTCPDPYWKDISEIKEEIALWQGDFEFPLEVTADGIEMGHRVSNLIVNANNVGDAECGMRIEFTALATVVNPYLLNVYTQEFMKVKRTLVAGDKLVIETSFGSKKVEMVHNNVATNVFNYIDLQSTFLQLSPGDNLFRYNAESGIDNLECAIYFTPKYAGV